MEQITFPRFNRTWEWIIIQLKLLNATVHWGLCWTVLD